MKRDYYHVAKHERQKMNVTQAYVHIMAHATKQTKFAAYQVPYVKVSQLSQSQYGQLVREQHSVSDWNHILFAFNQSKYKDDMEFEEVKMRAAKKPGSIPAFIPSKRVKFEGYYSAEDSFVLMEVPSATKTPPQARCLQVRGGIFHADRGCLGCRVFLLGHAGQKTARASDNHGYIQIGNGRKSNGGGR
jgi:hypothetical protein